MPHTIYIFNISKTPT